MTISTDIPPILYARAKHSAEYDAAVSKQPYLSREMAMTYRSIGIAAWIFQTCYWLQGYYTGRNDFAPLTHLCLAAASSTIVAIHFRDVPTTTKIRLCVHATLLYFAFFITGGNLLSVSLAYAEDGQAKVSVILGLVAVYWWLIFTAIIWGFLVSIGPQDESDVRLPYWFKEFLPHGLAKHIKERNSSKERSGIDKKEQ